MRHYFGVSLAFVIALSSGSAFGAQATPDCRGFDPKADQSMKVWSQPAARACTPKVKTIAGVAYLLPDPDCTPGAINPTLKVSVLKKPGFRTACERNKATSADAKNNTYDWYDINHPSNNTAATQTCELDHLIS